VGASRAQCERNAWGDSRKLQKSAGGMASVAEASAALAVSRVGPPRPFVVMHYGRDWP